MSLAELQFPPPFRETPFLRWAGGKSWFVREYGDGMFHYLQKQGGRYIEPFLGGGAMALHLGLPGMILGDLEEDLILTYVTIRDALDELGAMLLQLQEYGTDKKSYYLVRSLKPSSSVERAAKFLYLNRLCFNGLYRLNKSGGFNVPYGGRDKKLLTKDDLWLAHLALQGAHLFCRDFAELISKASTGDIIYADPPYAAGHTSYTAQGFSDDDQERLAWELERAHKRGAQILAHNADTPQTRSLYKWAEVQTIQESRRINSDGNGRGGTDCVMIMAM